MILFSKRITNKRDLKKNNDIKEVFKRYLSNQHSVEDFRQIQSYFTAREEGELSDLIENKLARDYPSDEEHKVAHIISKTDDTINKLILQDRQNTWYGAKSSVRNLKVLSFAVAAILFCIVSISLYFISTDSDSPTDIDYIVDQSSLGGNKATLTLGDGTVLSLDSMDLGLILETKGLLLSKDAEGVITYKTIAGTSDATNSFSTLKTPLGGQYKVILEDGTKVWLNAASSISYPNRFDAQERRVELIGEAYFEVSKDKNKPFIVVSGGQQVTVLGTEFNINTSDYHGNIKTTLIEGAVKVANKDKTLILTPGQQAVVKNGNTVLLDKVDIKEVTAWKRGEFYFDGAKINEIMHHIQKWYNVEIEYRGAIEHSFVLKISREANLTEILNILEMTDLVHFKIEKNKVIVTP